MAQKNKKAKKPKKNSYHRVGHSHEPRARLLRRVLMYSAFTVLTILLSILIFYRAKGYTFTKNGQVEKRGIILINSAPITSRISIDGKDTGKKTDYKLEISEGNHRLKLEADGYRTWETSFDIRSEQVKWFYYPYLIPTNIVEDVIQANLPSKTYSSLSSDNEIIAASKTGSGRNESFSLELLQLKEDNPLSTAKQLIVPTQIFSRQADGSLGNLTFGRWSPNGDSIFIEYTFDDKKEIINLRIDSAGESSNLTNSLGSALSEYRYDESSKLHLLNNGELAIYNPKTLQKETIIDTGVLSFNTFQNNKYVYTKTSIINEVAGLDIVIKEGDNQPKKVTHLSAANPQDLDFHYTTNRRTNYLSVTNLATKELLIYRSPLDSKEGSEPMFLSSFKSLQSNQIKPSPLGSPQPGSYIALQLSTSTVFIYDFEAERSITYDLSPYIGSSSVSNMSWIDSERLQIRTVDNKVYYFDYDGNYVNQITKTDQPLSFFIKSENKTVIINSAEPGKQTFSQIKFKKQ